MFLPQSFSRTAQRKCSRFLIALRPFSSFCAWHSTRRSASMFCATFLFVRCSVLSCAYFSEFLSFKHATSVVSTYPHCCTLALAPNTSLRISLYFFVNIFSISSDDVTTVGLATQHGCAEESKRSLSSGQRPHRRNDPTMFQRMNAAVTLSAIVDLSMRNVRCALRYVILSRTERVAL